ncbi:MAG: DUF4430 domain-containing protein [Lachnospiraceae bacterium]|nr:DUF4430 domain-containing protein [Lachnospiraceae bacterium]
MQNKMRRRRHNLILWSLAVVLLLTSFFDAFSSVGPVRRVFADTTAERTSTAEQLLTKCREALSWKMKAAGVASEQELLDAMAARAGRSPEDWYVLAMAKMGLKLDYTKYANALFEVCKDPEPTDVEQYRRYLTARAMGYEDIPGTAPEKLKDKGIMSAIYRGYAVAAGRASSSFVYGETQSALIALKLADGGYALMGETSDVDVTAFVLQAYGALLGAQGKNAAGAELATAVSDAFAVLGKRQSADGGYASFGTANAESGAMVLLALAAFSDKDIAAEVRNSVNASALIAATDRFQTAKGGYAHALSDGVASMENDLATAQVMCAYAAYASYLKGASGRLYPVKAAAAPVEPTTQKPTQKPTEASTEETTAKKTEASTEETTKKGTEASAEETTKKGTEASAQETTAKGTEVSAEETTEETAEVSTEDTTETSTEASTEETRESSTEETTVLPEETTTSTDSTESSFAETTTKEDSNETTPSTPTEGSDIEKSEDSSSTSAGTVRWIMTAVVAGLILLGLLANTCSKRRSKVTYVAILVLGAAALIFVWMSKITLPEHATQKQQQTYLERLPAQGEFRIEICIDQRVEGEEMLLTSRLVTVSEDDTVFDILQRVAMAYGIAIDYTKSMVGTVYVRAIGGHAEFDRGAGSGWVFLVNDALATTDAGSVKLSAGDVVRWAYTLDLGKDVSP